MGMVVWIDGDRGEVGEVGGVGEQGRDGVRFRRGDSIHGLICCILCRTFDLELLVRGRKRLGALVPRPDPESLTFILIVGSFPNKLRWRNHLNIRERRKEGKFNSDAPTGDMGDRVSDLLTDTLLVLRLIANQTVDRVNDSRRRPREGRLPILVSKGDRPPQLSSCGRPIPSLRIHP